MINNDSVKDFKQKGFCLLKSSFPENLLNAWRNLAIRVENECLLKHEQGIFQSNAGIVDGPTGPQLLRCNDIYISDPELTFATLSCPILLNVMKNLCGKGAVPLQMDIVFKQPYPQPITRWHQDAVHNRRFPYINVGIYLDDAQENDGCLTCVPGTQNTPQDIQALAEQYGWDIPGAIDVPTQAGDILVHDMMIIHGSKPKRTQGARRTIYIEIRPWQGIIDAGQQSKEWSDVRKQWMAEILNLDHQGVWPKEWKAQYPPPQNDKGLFDTITQTKGRPAPSVWEVFPVEKDGYPIPVDFIKS